MVIWRLPKPEFEDDFQPDKNAMKILFVSSVSPGFGRVPGAKPTWQHSAQGLRQNALRESDDLCLK
jgi:hypothetical protein